ncbi:SRPBCC family protein [Oculatella sp. LEGE 06141]|uniref:SRPBCC family protein n=1 Tax=Oculatella sp. LEGE 06141 TaxID=1828648 RepID=UPI001D15B4AA|nr:SRPBCC family protein [Oculatella sp. LEGE 06141]
MLGFWSRFVHRDLGWFRPLVETYQVISSASVDDLWRKVVNIADVSWHPLLASTNVPKGLLPKPGLIYRAVTRLFPFPIRIFVERVTPRELLSVRILALPGIEERVTYRVESTVWGTRVSYSVTLRGWLSPLIWSIIRPYAARVASELASAAEQERSEMGSTKPKTTKRNSHGLLGVVLIAFSIGNSISGLIVVPR